MRTLPRFFFLSHYCLAVLLLIGFTLPVYADDHKWDNYIEVASAQTGVSASLIKAIIRQESHFRDDIGHGTRLSSAGAIGAMQLMPGTAKQMGYSAAQMKDLQTNIMAGAKYLKYLQGLSYIGKDVLLIAAAYNAGPGAVKKYNGVPPYKETVPYVKNVAKHYAQYSGTPLNIASLPTPTKSGGRLGIKGLGAINLVPVVYANNNEILKKFEAYLGLSGNRLRMIFQGILVFIMMFFAGLQILFFWSEAVNQSDRSSFFSSLINSLRTLFLVGVLFSFISL